MGLITLSGQDLTVLQVTCFNLQQAMVALISVDPALRVDLSGWPEVAIRRSGIPVVRDELRDRRGAVRSDLPVATGADKVGQDRETGAAPAQTGEHPEADARVDVLPVWQWSYASDCDGDDEFESVVGAPPPAPATADRGDGPTRAPVDYDVTHYEPVPPYPPADGAVDRGGDAAPVAEVDGRVTAGAQRFTPADIDQLRAMKAAGKSNDAIAAALGRTKKQVQGMLAYLARDDVKAGHVRGGFSVAECDAMLALRAEGKTDIEIAATLNRPVQGVAMWLRNPQRWSVAEDDAVIAGVVAGRSAREIAAELGRGYEGVKSRITVMLKDRIAAARRDAGVVVPVNKPWTEAEDAQLVAAAAAGNPLKEVAAAMQRPFDGLKFRVYNTLKDRIAVARRDAVAPNEAARIAVSAVPAKVVEKPLYDAKPMASVAARQPAPVTARPVVQPMAVVAAGEIVARPTPWDIHLAQLPTRAPHSAASDLELVERLGRGEKMAAIVIDMGIDGHALKSRWLALHPDPVTPKSQADLLAALRRRVGVAA